MFQLIIVGIIGSNLLLGYVVLKKNSAPEIQPFSESTDDVFPQTIPQKNTHIIMHIWYMYIVYTYSIYTFNTYILIHIIFTYPIFTYIYIYIIYIYICTYR